MPFFPLTRLSQIFFKPYTWVKSHCRSCIFLQRLLSCFSCLKTPKPYGKPEAFDNRVTVYQPNLTENKESENSKGEINFARLVMEEFPTILSVLRNTHDYSKLCDDFSMETGALVLAGHQRYFARGKKWDMEVNFAKHYNLSTDPDIFPHFFLAFMGCYIRTCHNIQLILKPEAWKDHFEGINLPVEVINKNACSLLNLGIIFLRKIIHKFKDLEPNAHKNSVCEFAGSQLGTLIATFSQPRPTLKEKYPNLNKSVFMEKPLIKHLKEAIIEKNKDKSIDPDSVFLIAGDIQNVLVKYTANVLVFAFNRDVNYELINLAPFDHLLPLEELLPSSQEERELLSSALESFSL